MTIAGQLLAGNYHLGMNLHYDRVSAIKAFFPRQQPR